MQDISDSLISVFIHVLYIYEIEKIFYALKRYMYIVDEK